MKATTIIPIVLAVTVFAACNTTCPEEQLPEQLPDKPQPIAYDTEKPEPVTNDFTLIKACIGKSQDESDALLVEHGYTASEDGKYTKTENGVKKDVHIYAQGNASMVSRSNEFSVLKSVFTQQLTDMRQSATYNNLLRSSYSLKPSLSKGKTAFATPEELLAALEPITEPEDKYMDASFDGNDCFATRYELVLDPSFNAVYLQMWNARAGQPSDDFTESDLNEEDLSKHILISKVDYLTFRYKGFYAMNVNSKSDSGQEIPIHLEYVAPCDFGSIKLYYNDKSNLLLDGTIIWSGCGRLGFPESFRAGLPVQNGLAYPGQERFAFISDDRTYLTEDKEQDLQHIWESVSKQKEFQYYYANSSKKVAVYLYTPSVGMMDPNVACYFVFTEQ